MILIEDKLFETKIIKSDYPGCDIEVVYAPYKPSEEYYKASQHQIDLLKKILEDSYILCERLKKSIENMIPPKSDI
jgi:hypothetical protein